MRSFIRKEVLETPAYPAPHGEGRIKLNQNESPWDIPAGLRMKIVERCLNHAWNRYPEAEPLALKKQLAAHLGLWPDHLLLANGSNVLVQAILVAIAVRKKVLVLKPSFSLYALQSRLLSNKLIEVALNPDFSMNLDAVLAAMLKETPSLVVIANPNAPTGTGFDPEAVLEIVKRASCPVVVDEAYYPFYPHTLVKEVERYPRLIVLRTFSKAFAMAGVRLGYLVADVDVVEQIGKVVLPFRISTLTQIVAETVLEAPQWTTEYVQKIVAERERVYTRLTQSSGVQAFPSHANFILFRVLNAKEVFRQLMQHEVLVRDVSDDGMLSNCLRVSIGTPQENQCFLDALQKILR